MSEANLKLFDSMLNVLLDKNFMKIELYKYKKDCGEKKWHGI